MKKYSVMIVGAGSIGALKPDNIDNPTSKNVLTHAHAAYNNPRTELVAIVDSDLEKACRASEKWKHNFEELPQAISSIQNYSKQADIIIIATPTDTHFGILMDAINQKPSLIIAEKPFTGNLDEAKRISDICKERKIPILVNYTRRFVPTIRMIRTQIQRRLYGIVQNCRVVYNRGIMREASHAIDLMRFFFGQCTHAEIIDPSSAILDYDHEDPTYNAFFKFEECPSVFFTPSDGRMFSIFEIDIIFEKARLTFIEHGTKYQLRVTEPEPIYGNYLALKSDPVMTEETDLTKALHFLMKNAVDFLDGNADLICTDKEAIKVHEVYKKFCVFFQAI